jgi:hypothetical protein
VRSKVEEGFNVLTRAPLNVVQEAGGAPKAPSPTAGFSNPALLIVMGRAAKDVAHKHKVRRLVGVWSDLEYVFMRRLGPREV